MGLHENMHSETVSRLALREPVVVQETSTIGEAVTAMRKHQLGCAIVLSPNRVPIGLFPESELTRLLSKNSDVIDEPISKHLKKDWPTVKLTDPIARVLDALESYNVRFLIVVNEDGQLAGLTGQKGLMEYVAEHFPGQVNVQRIGGNPYPVEREGA
ncbi:inosine 5-monophosphate dehydrogenase [Bythopirellula goksoeyrii]|uniref:Inosine 5-monophosphate dehydrogenase n=2 Tax=Bythopirellula goksoeyrii TaxID=1400387 RepID=A0A5B9Q8M3_9BACT|nr:inosine 5-monophosphate dehydrogenase [Bythopirellula goksoeyrii]